MNKRGLTSLIFQTLLSFFALGQETIIKNWKIAATTQIDLEVVRQVEKKCLQDSSACKKFYLKELDYFPIEKSFDRMTELTGIISKREFILFELFYPFVGFDPKEGYTTRLCVMKKRRIKSIEVYNESNREFEPVSNKILAKSIQRSLDAKSDCYGTGYSIITVFDKNMEIVKFKIVLSIEIK